MKFDKITVGLPFEDTNNLCWSMIEISTRNINTKYHF